MRPLLPLATGVIPLGTLRASVTLSATFSATTIEELVMLVLVAMTVALIARNLRFPYTLALVLVGLVLGLIGVLPGIELTPSVVLLIFIPALLFEGAWSSEIRVMRENWLPILLLAVPGLLLALLIIGAVLHFSAGIAWLPALLIGAIVSPTDPIAVVALLRQLGMPVRLRTIIEGESLFNDGVGAAVYVVVLSLSLTAIGQPGAFGGLPTFAVVLRILWLFVGGPLVGVVLGLLTARIFVHVEDHLIETAITFAVAYGAYVIGDRLATSGLLATVCAALVLGSYGRRVGLGDVVSDRVDTVWEFVGFVANSLLFLLLGLRIGATDLLSAVSPILWAVVGVFVGRAVMVSLSLAAQDALAHLLSRRERERKQPRQFVAPIPRRWWPLIALSGLRGALSLALVLSLPVGVPNSGLLAQVVFGVVLVTLVGQGVAMRFLLPRWRLGTDQHQFCSDAQDRLT